jgi:DNA-directed RNA polymerase beta subunit
LSLFHYSPGDFEQAADYTTLQQRLTEIEKNIGTHANKLFFFSVLPHHYETIFKNAARVGLTKGGTGTWARLLVEKPLGHDEKSARKLNKILGTLFKEEQIYRIEHYLAKDMGNIARYKLNRRFDFDIPNDEEHRTFQVPDFIEILKELIRLNNGDGSADDIDHLSNRRATDMCRTILRR